MGGGQGGDPLIALKEQELNIKAQATEADIAEGQQKLDLERQKMAQRDRQFDDRLQSQEQLSREKIQASTQREIMRNQNRGQ